MHPIISFLFSYSIAFCKIPFVTVSNIMHQNLTVSKWSFPFITWITLRVHFVCDSCQFKNYILYNAVWVFRDWVCREQLETWRKILQHFLSFLNKGFSEIKSIELGMVHKENIQCLMSITHIQNTLHVVLRIFKMTVNHQILWEINNQRV